MSNTNKVNNQNINTRCVNSGIISDDTVDDEITVVPIREYVEVVVNNKHGGFGLSREAQKLYTERSSVKYNRNICRHDPVLINIVKELGKDANKPGTSDLSIEKIPLEFKDCYKIDDYEGVENINLSSQLLVCHLLKNMDISKMYPDEAHDELLNLQGILRTDYYAYKF